jgi:hypothetical protein
MIDLPPRKTAGEVLDDVEKLLATPSSSKMKTLVRLAEGLADYDCRLMSPADRARWETRRESQQEKRVIALSEKVGFKKGAKIGVKKGATIATVSWVLLGAFIWWHYLRLR